MSNSSLQLSLPYIQGGQAQKHVTHNEAIRALDTLVHLSVLDQRTAPLGDEVDGDRVIVASGATGLFEGRDGFVAVFESGAWTYLEPNTGWTAFNQATGGHVVFGGTTWDPLAGGGGSVTSTPQLGINASADTNNRLTVSADATLLTHDATGGHQIKVNKSAASDTASLLFQTGFSGRAEMGTAGSDNFEIKVSTDGVSFTSALVVDAATGGVSLPQTSFVDPAFGTSGLTNIAHVASRNGLVTNGTAYLGNAYNYPAGLVFDGTQTPDTAGAVVKTGYYTGAEEFSEAIAIDPNRVFQLGAYFRQDSVAGDWSGFANADRHAQYLGLRCYDADGLPIDAAHHMRFHHAGTDSRTVLTAPLAPGDTTIELADASGWNETSTDAADRGIVIFGYRNGAGRAFDDYSRIEASDLFNLGNVDKALGLVMLNQPLPATLGNPDDPGGVWPAGTIIANRANGWNYKFALLNEQTPAATDTWYFARNSVGGVDRSGKNVMRNFPPGTASVRIVTLLNYTNRSGGFGSYPDTGTNQRLWLAGVSMDPDLSAQITRDPDGSCRIHVVQGNPLDGTVGFVQSALSIAAV